MGRRVTEGFVYVLRLGSLYKIGCSTTPRRRAAAFGSSLVHTIASANAHDVEQCLHRFFRKCRAHGEWFHLDEEAVALLSSLGRVDTIDDLPEAVRVAGNKKRAALFVDIDADVKHRFDVLVAVTRRQLSAEVRLALERHLAEEEPKYGLPLPDQANE